MGEHDGHRERLRQRFIQHGLDGLPDHEVLELLLFYALPRRDTNALARSLLKHFGSLEKVMEASIHDLQQVQGIGENAAVLIHLVVPIARRYQLSKNEKGFVVTSVKASAEYLKPFFLGAKEECIYLMCLDSKNKVISCLQLQEGSGNTVYLPIRKAAEVAIACSAASVILSHNHPTGVPTPSHADIETTRMLKNALEPLGIYVSDHIIIAGDQYYSMRATGALNW